MRSVKGRRGRDLHLTEDGTTYLSTEQHPAIPEDEGELDRAFRLGMAVGAALVAWGEAIRSNRCSECGRKYVQPYTKTGFGGKAWCSMSCSHFQ